jgi:hypothetical protein
MSHELRNKIAAEAARLMLRGKQGDFLSARRQAGRWLIRGKIPADELPTIAEIQRELYSLARMERLVQHSEMIGDDDAEELTTEERFAALRLLLEPLERFRMDPKIHPEGDALYHSLQVFELGRAARPYDEEFLLACLLHDVGLGLDPAHPVPAAVAALSGLVTERTLFLIEYRPAATIYLQTGECPRSLRKSEDFEELLLLARCNRDGCVAGAQVCTLDEALEFLADLDADDESASLD